MYSKVIDKLQPSPIQVMAERTRQAIAAGQSVVDMTLGEPDFPTPAHVCEAAVQAITDGQTRYTPINGTVPLREAILAKFKRENGISCALSEISVGCGGKQVIYQAFLATLNPGDEVAIPTPYWASYADIVSMNGGVLHPIQTTPEQGYALTVEALEEALNNKTKWLVLNSPSNPSGTAYTKEQLLKFAEVIRRCPHKSFFILVDDIYEHILFDGRVFVTLASIAPDLADRILTVNGVSKAYAMTGWRVGYACGPRPLIDAMTKVQMQINSHTSSISQAAATAALNGPQEEIALRRDVFQRRRDYLLENFSTIDGLYTPKPEGAFYLFPDVRAFIGKKTPEGTRIDSDVVLAGYLLEKGVAIVPGSGFGMPGFMRLSYATSDEKLQMASVRLAGALGALA